MTKKNPLDKILGIVRNIKEDAAAVPTNSLAGGQIAGTKEAGDDPPVFPKKKRKPTPEGRYGTRRTWRQQSGKS